MNPECAQYCPIARECASIAAGLESTRESLLDQSVHILAAEDYEQQAELYGALSILNGEVTAEQSDEFDAKINEYFKEGFGVSKEEWFERAATEVPAELAEVRQAEAAISTATGAIALACADCKGPKVSLGARLGELKDHFSDYWRNRRFSGGIRKSFEESAQQRQADRHTLNLTMHGRCTSKSAKQAFRQALNDPMVNSLQRQSQYFK